MFLFVYVIGFQRYEKCLPEFYLILVSSTHGSQWSPVLNSVPFSRPIFDASTHKLKKMLSSLLKSFIDMALGM